MHGMHFYSGAELRPVELVNMPDEARLENNNFKNGCQTCIRALMRNNGFPREAEERDKNIKY